MEDVFINVVGNYYCDNKVEVNAGDFVILHPELMNKYDRDAIIVINTTNEKIGYVSNSDKTVAEGCKKASEIRHFVNGICTGKVFFKKDNVIIVKLDEFPV